MSIWMVRAFAGLAVCLALTTAVLAGQDARKCSTLHGSLEMSPDGRRVASLLLCFTRQSARTHRPTQLRIVDRHGGDEMLVIDDVIGDMLGWMTPSEVWYLAERAGVGAKPVTLWAYDPVRRTRRKVETITADRQPVGPFRGDGCSLIRVRGQAGGADAPETWMLVGPTGFTPVAIDAATDWRAYWLGGSRRFVISAPKPGDTLQSRWTVSCDGVVEKREGLNIPWSRLSQLKWAMKSDTLLMWVGEGDWGSPEARTQSLDGVRLIQVRGSLSQSIAVSSDGAFYAVQPISAPLQVFRSEDNGLVGETPEVDDDRDYRFSPDGRSVLFVDDREAIKIRALPATRAD